MGTVAAIEKILKQNGRKLTGKYKRHLGTLSKPELLKIYNTFKAEVEAWHQKHAEEARAIEAAQAAPVPVEPTPVRKIQLRKSEG